MRLKCVGVVILALLLAGCVESKVVIPPLDLQREIFLAQDDNARKLLSVYDAKLRRIVIAFAKDTLGKELAKITDPEGRAKVSDILAVFQAVEEERDKDITALDKKKAEHLNSLSNNKAAFLAIDLKLREYMQSASATPATVNQITSDLIQIYKQFAERRPE